MALREAPSEARQRLLDTADRLFYREGFRGVGIDRIIAEAGVAKMSLYKHFSSKDDLILAVLQQREAVFQAALGASIERFRKKTRDPMQALFGALKEWFESPGFRGCAFINAAVEIANPDHPAVEFVQAQKRRFCVFLKDYIEQSLGAKAGVLAPAVGLLVEGAIVTAVIQGSPDAVDVARDAAARLVAAEIDK